FGSSMYATAGAARASIGRFARQTTAPARVLGSGEASALTIAGWNESFHSPSFASSTGIIVRPGVQCQHLPIAPRAVARTSAFAAVSVVEPQPPKPVRPAAVAAIPRNVFSVQVVRRRVVVMAGVPPCLCLGPILAKVESMPDLRRDMIVGRPGRARSFSAQPR